VEKIWKIFPTLAEVVRVDHVAYDMKATGHPFDHTLTVAQIAFTIAEDGRVAYLAGAAGLCHNADRLLQKQLGGVGKKDVSEEMVIAMIERWLGSSDEHFSARDRKRILKAVLRHSLPNQDDGDDVLVALQDADRVACSMPEQIMGAAQFRPDLPTIDPQFLHRDPSAHSYRDPRSVLKSLECWCDCADSENTKFCVRLPEAKKLMQRHIHFLRAYLREVEDRRMELGLWPDYPFKV